MAATRKNQLSRKALAVQAKVSTPVSSLAIARAAAVAAAMGVALQ
jgi:hypothetical protein